MHHRNRSRRAAVRMAVSQRPLYDYAGLDRAVRERLAHDVASHRTLADVLAWCRAQSPPLAVAEILTQDEYSHDVIVPAGERLVLVFDVT